MNKNHILFFLFCYFAMPFHIKACQEAQPATILVEMHTHNYGVPCRKSECGPGPKMMTPEEYEKHIARGAQIAREATINFERAEEEATENNSRQLLMQEENRAFNELNIKFCLYKRLCRDVVLKTLSYHS